MSDDFDDLIVGEKPKGRTPPYIAYKTLLTLLQEFKANGLPPQIDRSVLVRFAGGLQGQIMLALRSLDLMDDSKRPTDKLKPLVDAYETPQFAERLRPIIEATYPHVLKLDLMNATPSMFAEAFKVGTDAKEDVLRKCRTFFLHAAKDVGIPLGPRIEKAKFPRRSTNGARKPKPAKIETPAGGDDHSNADDQGSRDKGKISDKALEYKLVDLMKEEDVGDDERTAIWTLIQYLTAKNKKKATTP